MTARITNLEDVLKLEDFLGDFPEITRKAASMSINSVVNGPGLAEYRKGIAEQVAFPSGYLSNDRLGVTQHATPNRLEARITGRQRATSLARFATSGTVGSKGGVRVKVKKGGGSRFIESAFLVRLRAGAGISDDSFNLGLALRLKPGQTVIGKKDTSRMVRLDANVVLLYGPSIDQILRNDVADAKTPVVVNKIADEFFRNFARLAR
jgi:hypothetical protein